MPVINKKKKTNVDVMRKHIEKVFREHLDKYIGEINNSSNREKLFKEITEIANDVIDKYISSYIESM